MALEKVDDSHPEVSWGGIFSGVFMVLGLQFLFTILGTGIGFSILHPASGKGVAIGAAIYFFVTMLISFYFGGYIAARFAGPRYRLNAALHGVTVWAIVAALTAFTLGSSIQGLIGGGLNMAGQVAQENVIITPPSAGQGPQVQIPRANQMTPEQRQQLQDQAKQAAGQAQKVAASGSWYFFITFFLGMIAAALGGSFGGSYFFRKARIH